MNIFDSIEQQAQQWPYRPAVICGTHLLGFRSLSNVTAAVAIRFALHGIVAGDVVMVSSRNPMVILVLMLALARLGAVSMAAPNGPAITEMIDRCKVRALVSGPGKPPVECGAQVLMLSDAELLAPGATAPTVFQTFNATAQTPSRIGLSSGTTGRPKAVLWSHGATLAAWQSLIPLYPLTPADRVLLFMDMQINFATNHALRVLGSGATLVLPAQATASEMVRLIDLHGVTQVNTVGFLALGLVEFLQQSGHQQGVRFAALNQFVVGGEGLSPHVQRSLREHVCANLVSNYGSSEAALMARADAALMDQHPQAAGQLLPLVQAQAMDPTGHPLPPGEVGLLRFRTPGMASGYVGDAALSAQTFKDGWYHSSDMGSIDRHGIVTLGVRSEERLQWAGKLFDPIVIEAAMLTLPGVSEAVVFVVEGDQNEPKLAGLYVANRPLPATEMRQHCASRLAADLLPQLLAKVDAIPRNRRGKVSRLDLSLRFKPEEHKASPGSDELALRPATGPDGAQQ